MSEFYRNELLTKLRAIQLRIPGIIDPFYEDISIEELERRLEKASLDVRYCSLELIYIDLKQLALKFDKMDDAIQYKMDNGLRDVSEAKRKRHIEWIRILYSHVHFTFREWHDILDTSVVM
jgi:hypothetical protein